MTICIAAICEEKYVVIATDRMITVRVPNIEYEQSNITKIYEITDRCLAATAGSAIAFTTMLKNSKVDISKNSLTDIGIISECIRQNYVKERNKKVEEEILASVGLNFQSFFQTNQALQQPLAASIFQNIQRYNYQLWILLGGVDDNGGHIWHIENPGKKMCLDRIGFHAVGSGQHHVVSSFIANEFDPTIDLSHGLAITYEAKKLSEKATGVGKMTDIVIIGSEGYKRLEKDEIIKLEEIYQKGREMDKAKITELDKMIEKLKLIPNV